MMRTARKSRLLAALPLLGMLASNAQALEYNLPDPPGTLVFDQVPYRVVPTPNEKIPDTCESSYRASMESSFKEIWAQCQNVGRMVPSDCQRSLFDRCTKVAADLQKMESGACTKMIDESDAIQSFQKVDNQKNAQSSTADLNRRAYVATKQVINTLQKNAQDIEAHRKNALATLNAGACNLSTAGAQYQTVTARVNSELSATRGKINSTIQGKQAAAAQFAVNSGVSVQNLDKLVSLPPRSSTITGATSRPEDTSGTPVVNPHTSVYVGTVVETITTPAAPVTTTTTSPVTTVATSNAVPAPIMLPPYVPPPPEHKNINWVPILAVGIPAAILTALVVSKASKSRVSDSPQSGADGGGGGADPNPPQTNGNHNPPPSVVPGGGDLAAWHITLDPAFTDAEKATIAAALQRIPACYRYKLQGIYVQSKQLPRTSDGCVAGLFMLPNGNTVYLSPTCAGVQVGITVHEFFHVIGSRNNNAVHNQWWPIRARYNNCPVTHYGETNQFEDFAEAGRLVEAPDTGMEARYSGVCVDAKVDGLRKIMNRCPGQ